MSEHGLGEQLHVPRHDVRATSKCGVGAARTNEAERAPRAGTEPQLRHLTGVAHQAHDVVEDCWCDMYGPGGTHEPLDLLRSADSLHVLDARA